MLHGAATHRHHIWVPVQPVLGRLQNGLMLPALYTRRSLPVVHFSLSGQVEQAVAQ